jgi:glycosyltransferase involved in cell wall biosynthesis
MSRKSQFNILFVNAREDSDRILGGDTIQFTKTKTALEKLGVRIDIASLNDLNRCPPVEIAHVFNIQMADSARSVFRALEKHRIPIILSPIYWDVYEYWFEAASTDRQTWRRLVKIMGNEKAGKIYVRWQKMKSPLAHDWQVQHILLEHARRVLPNSHAEAKLLKQSFLLPKKFFDRVDVVPNGIDPELFHTPPSPVINSCRSMA